MRPGRLQDLDALHRLLADEARRGERDCAPVRERLRRETAAVDWEARSRVLESQGQVCGAVLVTSREAPDGVLARVETATLAGVDPLPFLRWGVGLSRAAGARRVQVWKGRRTASAAGLESLGLAPARPFWRMDRPSLEVLPEVPWPPGYELAVGADWQRLATVYNRAFAEHWRHHPVEPEVAPPGERQPELDLLALGPGGEPVAAVWAEIERHEADPRQQPVGVVSVVGTVPEHRRHGLAAALTSEALRRLRRLGARSASLYVDGRNPTRAYDLYARLGFEVAFEYTVYEIQL